MKAKVQYFHPGFHSNIPIENIKANIVLLRDGTPLLLLITYKKDIY